MATGLLAVTGTGTGADTMTGSAIHHLHAGASPFPVATPTLDNRYMVNLPAANTNGSIGVSLLTGSTLVDLELSAAQNEGKSETISSPRVITANQKQADIMQGVEIPVPGISLERRHDHTIQKRRAVPESDAADHAG